MATVWTSYQGVEVVESDPRVPYRHPRRPNDDKSLANLPGATLLALVDGTFLVVCDVPDCRFNGITGHEPYVKPEGPYRDIVKQAGSLFSHINGKHYAGPTREARRVVARKPAQPVAPASEKTSRYSDAEIAVAIKIWLKWKGTGIKHFPQHACDELTARGFRTQYGGEWNSDQLGSLVHNHIKKEQFRNLKAGPVTEEEQSLVDMVREAQARESRPTGTHLADNVRITAKGSKTQPRSEHKPVDFAAIIAASETAREERQEDDITVVSSKEPAPKPTLNFGVAGTSAMEPTPTKTLVIEPGFVAAPVNIIPAQRQAPAPVAVPTPAPSDFALVSVLDDGIIIFTYKGTLMGGKPVKGVEI